MEDIIFNVISRESSPKECRCDFCNDTGLIFCQLKDLTQSQIKTLGFEDKIKQHIETYGDLNNETQGYALPCPNCKSQKISISSKYKERSNIPPSYYNNIITDFDWNIYTDSTGNKIDTNEIRKKILAFIKYFPKFQKENLGLYIHSTIKGSGKTFLASCICNTLIKEYPITTKFVSAADLLSIAKNSDGTGNYATDQLSLLKNCAFLCIDDLGQKNCGSDWMEDILFQIIDYRYTHKLITIFTSNISSGQLNLDSRITDRINDITVDIKLPDYCVRSKKANEKKLQFFKSLAEESNIAN